MLRSDDPLPRPKVVKKKRVVKSKDAPSAAPESSGPTKPRRRITGGLLKKDAKVASSPPPPPINKAQQECDSAFFGMLRGSELPHHGETKPDMQIGAISPRVSAESIYSEDAVRSSRDSDGRPMSSRRPLSSRRRRKQNEVSRNSVNRDSREEIALPRKAKLSEEEMNKIIEEDRVRFEEMQRERQKKAGQSKRKGAAKKAVGKSKLGFTSKVGGAAGGSKAMPLSVDRRKKQDAMIAQQNDGGSKDTRRNLDKRTARIRYSPHFIAAIKQYRNKNPHLNSNHNHRERRFDDNAMTNRSLNGVTVFVRKRPLFPYERQRKDYDVVSVHSDSDVDSDHVLIHNCVMHPDMKKMHHKPIVFGCSAAFDQHANNDDIYYNVAKPMLEKVLRGGIATILMYGQTGSGKTYTMTSIEERLGADLFSDACADCEVTVKFIELAGKKAVDLLGRRQGEEVRIVDEMQGMGNKEEVNSDPVPALSSKRKYVVIQVTMREGKENEAGEDVDEEMLQEFRRFNASAVRTFPKWSTAFVKVSSMFDYLEAIGDARLKGKYKDMAKVEENVVQSWRGEDTWEGWEEEGGEEEEVGNEDGGEEVPIILPPRVEAPVVCVKWKNAAELTVKSPEQLTKFINVGKSRRATEATDVNGTSSRSHAVLQITVRERGSKKRGMLTLIDCAGSERRNDSLYHDKERQKESAEINASLYALKNCIRARCEIREKPNTFIPYRSSLLTRVLRETFEDDAALLSIIATAAPNATDTEHTMETLKTVSSIVGTEKDIVELPTEKVLMAHELQELISGKPLSTQSGVNVVPRKWNHSQLLSWLKKASGGIFQNVNVVKSDTGKTVMSQTVVKLTDSMCHGDAILATQLFNKLRGETDRVERILLKKRIERKQRFKGLDG